MAQLSIINENKSTENIEQIQSYLKTENIEFGQFTLNDLSIQKASQDTLSDNERNSIIESYPDIINKYRKYFDYRADMICLYSEFKHLDFVLEKFKDVHYHYENEHWYYIDGSSGFGFLGLDGRKFTVEVNAGEYITVPEGKWQWVIPPKNNRMKAIRFFSCTRSIPKPKELQLN